MTVSTYYNKSLFSEAEQTLLDMYSTIPIGALPPIVKTLLRKDLQFTKLIESELIGVVVSPFHLDFKLAADNAKWLPAFAVSGGGPLPGSRFLGATFFLINGWRVNYHDLKVMASCPDLHWRKK